METCWKLIKTYWKNIVISKKLKSTKRSQFHRNTDKAQHSKSQMMLALEELSVYGIERVKVCGSGLYVLTGLCLLSSVDGIEMVKVCGSGLYILTGVCLLGCVDGIERVKVILPLPQISGK